MFFTGRSVLPTPKLTSEGGSVNRARISAEPTFRHSLKRQLAFAAVSLASAVYVTFGLWIDPGLAR